MNKIFIFFAKLYKEFTKNELVYMSYELTYKLLLSTFPLLIYLINILTFFGLKYDLFQSSFINTFPQSIALMLNSFVSSLSTFAESSNVNSIMNITLAVAIFSSSSGFFTIMRGINKTYGINDERNYFVKRLISILFVFMFTFIFLITGIFIIFSDLIINFIHILGFNFYVDGIYNFLMYFIPAVLVLVNVMFVYKFSCYKKISLKSTLPGAIITVVIWVLSSSAFNFYINNFSKYNAVYGVIGSFLIFILWINIIAVVLLIGSQINALLEEKFIVKE